MYITSDSSISRRSLSLFLFPSSCSPRRTDPARRVRLALAGDRPGARRAQRHPALRRSLFGFAGAQAGVGLPRVRGYVAVARNKVRQELHIPSILFAKSRAASTKLSCFFFSLQSC